MPSVRPRESVKVQSEAPDLGQRLLEFFGNRGQSRLLKEVAEINKLESAVTLLKTPEQFQARTADFRRRLAQGESLESLRVEAYAVARQAALVAVGKRPYDSQMVGALAMDNGRIAEMMTGEGKTLTALMPLYLNALMGKGAHLVTVNDTLAKRDRDEMAPIFETLGLSVGLVAESMSDQEKREGYSCDVTYTTDRAVGFDFLHDRLVRSADQRRQRPLFFALVDEVDEVLLDEARTPLILSGPGEAASPDYQVFDEIVGELVPGQDYFVDRAGGTAYLSESGMDFVENELYGRELSLKDPNALALYHKKRGALRAEGKALQALEAHRKNRPSFWQRLTHREWSRQEDALEQKLEEASQKADRLGETYSLFSPEHADRVRFLNASLKAHALFTPGIDYLVQDHQVKIVDENKGRTSKGRRYNEGVHQALEARSKVPIRPESRTLNSITYPNLFKNYERLAGMSGTAKSSEVEFFELYGLEVTQVATNLQFKISPQSPYSAPRHNRVDETDLVYGSKKEKFDAVVAEAIKAYEDGVPVMVGTLSVEANEYVYARLIAAGVPRGALQVLNAEHVRGDKTLENKIIAGAGRSGIITVATNMAGRGVDIKPDHVNYKKLALKVEELAGQQGQPLVVNVASEKEAKGLAAWLEGAYPYRIGGESPKPGETIIRVAGDKTGSEAAASLDSADFPTGGLYVIGTERAKSRRIDDQLIGRAGRQGEPGRSRFFLSLEDDLLQRHGGGGLQPALKLLSSQSGRLENELAQKLVAQAQARVGSQHFHSREDSADYDKVMNKQRETFFGIRDSILEPDADLRQKLVEDTVEVLLRALPDNSRLRREEIAPKLREHAGRLGLNLELVGAEKKISRDALETAVRSQVESQLRSLFSVFDAHQAPLDQPVRESLLDIYDNRWSEHLDQMDLLRLGAQWSSVAGELPETVYALRGFDEFESMLGSIQQQTVEQVIPQLTVAARLLTAGKALAPDAAA